MSTLKTITKSIDPNTPIPHPVWPLPKLNGQAPVLLVHDPDDPGVELAYEHKHDPDGALVRSTKNAGTVGFFLPALTPVFAVFDGRIMYAGKHADGHTLIVEHANGWMTYYSHLEHMFALATDRRHRACPQHVRAGNVLGYAGHRRADPLRPIRFELWKFDDDCGYLPIDPIRFMRRWRLMPWLESTSARGAPTVEGLHAAEEKAAVERARAEAAHIPAPDSHISEGAPNNDAQLATLAADLFLPRRGYLHRPRRSRFISTRR